MKQIRNILVPVDFSPAAQKAFRYALGLGGILQARIHLLHVIYPQPENIDDPLQPPGRATSAKQHIAERKMQQFIETAGQAWVNAGHSMPTLSSEVAVGGAVAVIRSVAKSEPFDLIVMGTRGEHEQIEHLLGTVASDAVGNAVCPVMVVPQQAPEKGLARIAHALDTHRGGTEKLAAVIHCLRPLHREVHLVRFGRSVPGDLPAGLPRMKAALEKRFPEIAVHIHVLNKRELTEDMNSFVRSEGIDLLVMYRSATSMFRKLFHRSHSRQMARKTIVPLLAV